MKISPFRRFLLPLSSFRAQIYLSVIAFAVAFGIIAAAGWIDAGQQVRRRLESEVDDGLSSFQSDFDRATLDLTGLGNWLVAQPTFADLVRSRDGPGLARYLAPWTEVSLADELTVTDQNGLVLTRLGAGQPLAQGDNVRSLPGIAEALSGRKSTLINQDSTGRLERLLVMPIYASESEAPTGTLELAFYLDGSFLQYRSRKPDQEIATVFQDKLTILTLTDSQGKPWGGQLAPPAALAAQQAGSQTAFLDLHIDVGNYLFKFKPFDPAPGSHEGMFGLGVSLASIESDQLSLFRVFLVGLAILALGTGAVGFLFARNLTVPIHSLNRAVREMSNGDLSKAIVLPRNDELGELARQLDSMRQQLNQAFQSSVLEKGRLAAVIRSMGAAALISDENLEIMAVNKSAEALLQQKEESLVGQPWHSLFATNGVEGKSSPSTWSLGEAEVGSGESLVVHGRFPLRTRPQLMLDVISSQVQVDGKPAGFVHVLSDATAQEQLTRAQDEFIMNAAHELRSPLASLRASIEVLVEDFANMDKQELSYMVKTMQRGVVRFQTLVENLVDVGTIQARRFRVRPTAVRLDDLIQNALIQVEPILQGRGQSVPVNMDCPSPCLVIADRPRISQVMINLLSNASKYGPEGMPISVHASSQEGFVVIEVTDSGPGIEPEEQSRLFQRFYRGRRAEEEGIGIGLGLALAREIVEAHGGRMDVRSQVGAGTTFWFSLPEAQPIDSIKDVEMESRV